LSLKIAKKLRAVEHRQCASIGEREDALVEVEPRHLAIEGSGSKARSQP
jgi:hypothetical protein